MMKAIVSVYSLAIEASVFNLFCKFSITELYEKKIVKMIKNDENTEFEPFQLTFSNIVLD